MYAALITGIVMVGLLAVFSIVLLSGHGGSLIAGYNTTSEEEKQKYDEKKLCRAVGMMLFITTIATAGLFFSIVRGVLILLSTVIYTPLILILAAVGIYYTNNKCLNPNYDSKAIKELKGLPKSPAYIRQKKKKLAFLIGAIAFSIVIAAVVFFAAIYSARPNVYIIKNGTFEISTGFGETVSLSDIEQMQLKDKMPEHLSKISGLDLGTTLKGEFEADGDRLHVYVDTAKPPFLYLYTKSGLIITNGKTKEETQALYERLQAKQ